MEIIDRDDIANDSGLSMDVKQNVQWLLDGLYTNIDFNAIENPVYRPKSRKELKELIRSCINMYGIGCSLNWIDVSRFYNFSNLFYNSVFEGDISKWDVSSAVHMTNMFSGSVFNGDLSGWNVSRVEDMSYMFCNSRFNNDSLAQWDVRNVKNMCGMFQFSVFNSDISTWETLRCDNMDYMFFHDSAFNRDISRWYVYKWTSVEKMFAGCPIKYEFRPRTMQTENRKINEDYMDVEMHRVDDAGSVLDHQLLVGEFCDIIDSIVAGEYEGERPDFENARDAIYPVDDRSIFKVIKRLRFQYGFEEHMNLNWLDVSRVTHMNTLFYQEFLPGNTKATCNVDVSRWDVRNVVSTSYMFSYGDFNGDLSAWKLDSLDDCSYMFAYSLYNRDLSSWDISGASDKRHMLDGCPIHKRMDCWPKGYNWD